MNESLLIDGVREHISREFIYDYFHSIMRSNRNAHWLIVQSIRYDFCIQTENFFSLQCRLTSVGRLVSRRNVSFHSEHVIGVLVCLNKMLSPMIIHKCEHCARVCAVCGIRCGRITFLARKVIAMIRLHICRHSMRWRCMTVVAYILRYNAMCE